MAEVARDLWRQFSPTPSSSKVSQSTSCPVGFGVSPGMEPPQPRWIICTSVQPPSESKGFFIVCMECFVFLSVLVASFSVTGHHWGESSSVVFTLSGTDTHYLDLHRALSSLQLFQPSLVCHVFWSLHLHGPFAGLTIMCIHVSRMLGSPEPDAALKMCLTRAE